MSLRFCVDKTNEEMVCHSYELCVASQMDSNCKWRNYQMQYENTPQYTFYDVCIEPTVVLCV